MEFIKPSDHIVGNLGFLKESLNKVVIRLMEGSILKTSAIRPSRPGAFLDFVFNIIFRISSGEKSSLCVGSCSPTFQVYSHVLTNDLIDF